MAKNKNAEPHSKKLCSYKKYGVYTATSCGQVGRGGNEHLPTFQLERDGPTDRRTDQRTDGWTKPLIESLVRD